MKALWTPLLAILFGSMIAQASSVSVVLDQPEEFTDLRIGSRANEEDFVRFKEAIETSLRRAAERRLPTDSVLEITFTDVDLAGDFEPWQRPQFDDVRIMRDVYPPRLSFRYRLRSGDGSLLLEGEERKVDLGYLTFSRSLSGGVHDRFHYEEKLMRDWLRQLSRVTEGPQDR